jgi:DNA-binding transcriptional LysR family regulator
MQWHDRIGRRLKLRDLHILLAVVQRGSMAKAAAELAISQPAVSKAIADMEYAVGQRLLDRTRRGMEPTTYGRVLIKRGMTIFDELKQAAQELDVLADPTVGELRIGTSESVAAGLLPAIIDRFSRQYPRVLLTVAQAVFATMQYRELRERNVDLLLGRNYAPFAEDDLESEVLFDDPPVVLSGRRSRWAKSRGLKLADLSHERWILPPADSLPRAGTAEVFRASGIDLPQAPLTTLSIHVALQLVATGRFVTILPRSILRFNGGERRLKELPIKLPILPRPIAIMRLKNRTLSPVAQRFIDCARAVGKMGGKSRTLARNR